MKYDLILLHPCRQVACITLPIMLTFGNLIPRGIASRGIGGMMSAGIAKSIRVMRQTVDCYLSWACLAGPTT